MKKLFHAWITINTIVDVRPGPKRGKTIFLNMVNSLAPSTSAALISSFGIDETNIVSRRGY